MLYTYHMSNLRKSIGVSREALQLHPVYLKKKTFLLQVTQEFVSVLRVTQDTALYCGDTYIIFSTLLCFYTIRL